MLTTSTLLLTTLLSLSLSSAEIIKVFATADYDGAADPFMFVPNELTANEGDILEFHFTGPGQGVLGGNHSVAQGTWDRPCEPAAEGFFSGYMGVNATSFEADMVFQVPVTNTNPWVFYCTQGTHCTRGMYGVLNGAGDQTLTSYRESITANKNGVAPNNVGGGRLLANNVSNILTGSSELVDSAGSIRTSLISVVLGLGVALLMTQ